jgi:hypothetical protein
VKVSTKRDESERLAKATVSSAKPARQKAANSAHGAESVESMSLPESWLDRVRLGFPQANSW